MMTDKFMLIKKYEGCKLKSYKCPAGVWTIGWGTTFYPDGNKVKKGDTCTQAEADGLLLWYCTTKIKLPKGEWGFNQETALYSLIYNIGQGAFDKSKCKKALEKREWQVAYDNWDWVSAGGKVLKGLVNRRKDEKSLFFEGVI